MTESTTDLIARFRELDATERRRLSLRIAIECATSDHAEIMGRIATLSREAADKKKRIDDLSAKLKAIDDGT